jgi:type II secretory pathway predicted ATPase ExeA
VLNKMQAYFGFTTLPFGRGLAVGQLFRSAAHNEAVARITYAVHTRALAILTGEVGAGKTVAARAALAGLDSSRHHLVYLPNPTIGARGIHTAIVTALGGTPRFHHATLVPQAAEALATEVAERGRTPVLVVDEAHLLGHDQLEAIRMLTNSELDSASPLACLLLGQPRLRHNMKLAVLAALDQRVTIRYTLNPMTPTETSQYLRHHTKLAGRGDTLFADDAADLIHHTSRGYPRAVNNIATAALIATYTSGKTIVAEPAVRTAAAEHTTTEHTGTSQ